MEKDEGRKSGVVVRLAANGFHSADCLESPVSVDVLFSITVINTESFCWRNSAF
jgi:hypothetical protein